MCPGFDDTADADGDSVPDGCDVCAAGDDNVDTDGDGAADACDACPNDDPDDTDGDGVCDSVDVCPGGDDGVDTDGDGTADFCDLCAGFDDTVDDNGNGVPDGCDGCGDPSTIEDFDGLMFGCPGTVSWPTRESLCGAGYSACSAVQWVDHRAGAVPTFNYWTADELGYDGPSAACSVSLTSTYSCATNNPMRVCTAAGGDSLGNTCNWENCGFETTLPNEYFGGCNGNLTAGTLCCDITDVDADGVPAVDDVCPGFDDTADADQDGVPDGCDICATGDDALDADTGEVPDACDLCPGSDDTVDLNGNGVPDGCDGCAAGIAREAFDGLMFGCRGTVSWPNRAGQCGAGFQACTALEWVTHRSGVVPTFNYWTDDDLGYSGSGSACSVSTSATYACYANEPMRVCTAAGGDSLGNACNWANCGFEVVSPNEYFGGCNNNNNTAGTLCCDYTDVDGDGIPAIDE